MQVGAELIERALEKLRQGAPYGVAAVLIGESTTPGMDGARWLVLVTDGPRTVRSLLSGQAPNGGRRRMNLNPAFIEGEVEWRAGHFAREQRLDVLLGSKTVVIRPDRLPEAAVPWR